MVFGPSRMKLPRGAPEYITPRDADQALTLVSYLGKRGVDLIKTHDSIPLASFTALMAEAMRHRIPVGGHVPFAPGSLGAARMGYRSIEHARDLLYDCSRYGPDYRRREAAFAEGVPDSQRPTSVERLRRTVDEFDPDLCRDLLQIVASKGVYYVPTHVTREMEARARDLQYRADPARRYVPSKRDANWENDLAETAALPDRETTALRDFFEHGLRITGLAYSAGIRVMVGTDTNDTMIVPGFSLHREMGLLRSAGLPPMAVLRAATTVPAAYFGRTDRLGGISPGKEADLVLLEQNPLDDIANTRAITAVIHNGRLLERAALDALLTETKSMAQPPLR
jgi:imidazolonepropionase-like amidohydrolase